MDRYGHYLGLEMLERLLREIPSIGVSDPLTLDQRERLLGLLCQSQDKLREGSRLVRSLIGRVEKMPVTAPSRLLSFRTPIVEKEERDIEDVVQRAHESRVLDFSRLRHLSREQMEVVQAVIPNQGLDELNLGDLSLQEEGVLGGVVDLIERSHLRRVSFAKARLSEGKFQTVCRALQNSANTLEYLNLEGAVAHPEAAFVALLDLLPRCLNLKNLSVIGLVEEEMLILLQAFVEAGHRGFESLAIGKIGGDGMGYLLRLLAPSLKDLSFEGELENRQILDLCHTLLQHHSLASLQTLKLGGDFLTSEALDALSQVLMQCQNVKTLSIRGVGDPFIHLISCLPSGLEKLEIDQCPNGHRGRIFKQCPKVRLCFLRESY